MTQNCKHCGEPIELDRDTKKLIEDGFVKHPDVCQECFDMISNQDNNDESFSDADPGL